LINAACIDASVAVKWFVLEDDSPLAISLFRDLRRSRSRLLAPPHFLAEVTSTVYKRYRRGEIDIDAALRVVRNLTRAGVGVRTPGGLAERAMEMAAGLALVLPYDAFYPRTR